MTYCGEGEPQGPLGHGDELRDPLFPTNLDAEKYLRSLPDRTSGFCFREPPAAERAHAWLSVRDRRPKGVSKAPPAEGDRGAPMM